MVDLEAEVELRYAALADQPPHAATQVAIIKKCLKLFLATFVYFDYDTTRSLLRGEYKQHNPEVGDGPESIIEFSQLANKKIQDLTGHTAERPDIRFKRILIDGDYVVLQSHVVRWKGDLGLNVFDMLRYKDGEFVEHWDSISQVPGQSKNDNGIF
ncbi:hypothetical protein AtubIFM61612_009465 [Aspergillus tubingensis]|nr:hypothetical protein AtubIFM61612_009465 [Aspergillus tubingensis]